MTTGEHTSKRTILSIAGTGVLAASIALGAAVPASAAPSTVAPAAATSAAAPTMLTPGTSAYVVEGWYNQLLGRDAASDAGSRYWVGQLDQGVPAPQVLAALERTPEYVQDRVAAFYRIYLNREPDTGSRYWVDGVVAGSFPLEWVEQNVASSTEYQLLRGEDINGSPTKVIGGWYQAVLDRAPSAGEVTYWTSRESAVGVLAAFRELWYTPEAVTKRIQGHYDFFLGRSAQPGEVAYWYGQEVASDAAVAAQIGGSAENSTRR